MEVQVRSKGDGLYACSYTPASSLKHTLAITWGGVSIPNSPFRVSSQSQRPVTKWSKILCKSGDLVKVENVVQSERFKAERVEVVQSELTETAQPECKDASTKTRKPLIIITTYTEERFSF